MKVVSNTSPLTNLAAIGQFDLLRQLYGQLWLAPQVWEELNAGGIAWPGSAEVATAEWIHICEIRSQTLVAALRTDLDAGEAASIALAVEIEADLILLDEREGRRIAQRLEIPVIGVLGVLLGAKKETLISTLHPMLDTLRHTAGFYVSEAVYHHVLHLAEED